MLDLRLAEISATADNTTELDWMAVRQYLASPPTVGTIQDV